MEIVGKFTHTRLKGLYDDLEHNLHWLPTRIREMGDVVTAEDRLQIDLMSYELSEARRRTPLLLALLNAGGLGTGPGSAAHAWSDLSRTVRTIHNHNLQAAALIAPARALCVRISRLRQSRRAHRRAYATVRAKYAEPSLSAHVLIHEQ